MVGLVQLISTLRTARTRVVATMHVRLPVASVVAVILAEILVGFHLAGVVDGARIDGASGSGSLSVSISGKNTSRVVFRSNVT